MADGVNADTIVPSHTINSSLLNCIIVLMH